MCGIVGVASTSPQGDKSWLTIARDLLAHRGPDDAGEWWSPDNRVGLGHRRLSIIDLSEAGHQPMVKPDLGLAIVFNGEIYNYRELRALLLSKRHVFTSDSDTEVVLLAYKEWGYECLARLNGMFSLAIYDTNKSTLFFGRDRAGEKPLYYLATKDSLYFASELKALLSRPNLPRKISQNQLDYYLAFGYAPSPNCILEGYKKLPPAHAMEYRLSDSELSVWRYWSLPQTNVTNPSEDHLVSELENILEKSVQRQLAADVPVGILLSGGIDSSLITAMACRHSQRVQTFSITFPNHPEKNEGPYAKIVAEYFKTEHVELAAEEITAEVMPMLARQFDEPMVDSSMIPTWLVSKLVKQNCSVALGGDGGDELFGGYIYYPRLASAYRLQRLTPLIVRRQLARAAERFMKPGAKGRQFLKMLGVDLKSTLPFQCGHFDYAVRQRLLGLKGNGADYALDRFFELMPTHPDIIERATRMDFSTYLAEDILVKVDRASMLNSLEVRSPFLDAEVIEFAFGKVPSELKVNSSRSKILPRRLAERVLPKSLELNRKQGFAIPLGNWLRHGSFRELFWQTLTDPTCVFDHEVVQELLDEQDRGVPNSERLFSLVMFELWRKEYGIYF
jgi:asparagine synthase (glutamine-hydrolysing)